MSKKPNITEIGKGLRKDTRDFFEYEILPVAHRKHTTPFIFYRKRKVQAFHYVSDLLMVANDNDVILKAWVGEYRTDIFTFTVAELREFFIQNKLVIEYKSPRSR